MKKRIVPLLLLALLVLASSCSFTKYAESDTLIVSAKEAMKLSGGDYVLLDAQKTTSYEKEHVKGAANIERNAITIGDPVPNSVAPASTIEAAAGMAGLTADSNVLIYDDNNNMDSGRLYWTLKYYGHKGDIRIVSGGLQALAKAGAEIVKGSESVAKASYKAGSADSSMMALISDIEKQIDNPSGNFKIIDVRTDEEYFAGTIPGSVHINYEENNFADGTMRPVQHIRILYKENGIMPEDTIVMYCKTSIRAANTYASLYNAGYRNIKVYDGAWLEWSASGNQVYVPEVNLPTVNVQQDNS